jgi:hypothetical protein
MTQPSLWIGLAASFAIFATCRPMSPLESDDRRGTEVPESPLLATTVSDPSVRPFDRGAANRAVAALDLASCVQGPPLLSAANSDAGHPVVVRTQTQSRRVSRDDAMFVHVTATFGADGHVSSIELSSDELHRGDSVESCIADRVAALKVPPFSLTPFTRGVPYGFLKWVPRHQGS